MYIYVYLCVYEEEKNQYPIPNSKKGYQKIPFLLTSCQNTDLQSKVVKLVKIVKNSEKHGT